MQLAVVVVVAGAGAGAGVAATAPPTAVEIAPTRSPAGPQRTASARGRRPAGAARPGPLSSLPQEGGEEGEGGPEDAVPVVVGGGVEVAGVAVGFPRGEGGVGTAVAEEGGGAGVEEEGGDVGAGGVNAPLRLVHWFAVGFVWYGATELSCRGRSFARCREKAGVRLSTKT